MQIRLFYSDKQVSITLLDQAVVSGANFATGLMLARFLGLEEFGKYSFIWMLVLLVTNIQLAAIITPMMSLGPKQPLDEHDGYYGAVLIQQTFWAGCSSLFFYFVMLLANNFYREYDLKLLAFASALALFGKQMQDYLRRYFFVNKKAMLAFVNDVVCYLGQLFCFLLLFFYKAMNARVVFYIIAFTSVIAFLFGLSNHLPVKCSGAMFKVVARKHLVFARWMVASSIMQWLSGTYYFIIVGSVLGPIALGGMKAAQNIVGIAHILFQAMENFAPAGASRALRRGGRELLIAYIQKISVIGMAGTAVFVCVIWFNVDWLLIKIFGPEFVEYSYVVKWFGVFYLISFLNMPIICGLRAIEQTKQLFLASFFTGVLSLLIAIPLTNYFELNGAMLGLLLTKTILLLILFFPC